MDIGIIVKETIMGKVKEKIGSKNLVYTSWMHRRMTMKSIRFNKRLKTGFKLYTLVVLQRIERQGNFC